WVDAPAQIFRFRRITVTAAGDITVNVDTDDLIVVNKSSGAATGVTLPSAVNRLRPLTIKDGKGDADTNNITITPNGVETIDGQSTWLINFAYGAVTLDPKDDGTGWLVI
ncbi:MAG: hypothetical protein KGZ69_15525, partial [Methylomonas sp.]|nr:hypothetical protein [Methylomonas sp.]